MSQHLEFPYAAPQPAAARPRREVGARRQSLGERVPGALVVAALVGTLAAGAQPAEAATELPPLLQKLASCEDSWLDWKRDETRMRAFGEVLMAHFRRDEKRRVWVPLRPLHYLGAEVSELTPQSVGMGLGFGVTLKAPMASLREGFEQAVGRKLGDCNSSDGLTSCGAELAQRKTAMMVSPTAKPQVGTLVGCYYYYEQ